jgi:hypothetical protein
MMPRHRVLLPRFDRTEKPRFVIAVREPFAHPDYEHYSTLEAGFVYQLRNAAVPPPAQPAGTPAFRR